MPADRTLRVLQSAALRDLETPALIVDLAALKRNIAAMAATAKMAGVALRPHAKTHKSSEIAALQMNAGAKGIACATVAEAEMLAAAGIGGLLLTAPQTGDGKFARIARINREHGLTVVVDHATQIEGLGRAVQSSDRKPAVAVDTDVGQMRTGVTDLAEGVRLAQTIAAHPRLEFAGIQGFAGNAQHIADPQARSAAAVAAADTLRAFAAMLSSAGLPPKLITGSGTGTYRQDSAGPYNELQVGSYVFMDSDYARIVDERGAGPSFEPSLFVLATIVSVNVPGQVTVDAGTKALATNGPPPCHIVGAPPGSTYRFAGDEHGIIAIPAGHALPAIGERLLIGATHCDPTVNLHGAYRVVEDDNVQTWPIRARYGER
ncbi:MAG: DSD1 family PLP-dependent enzyme [Xanthobacteraceae bacterium]